MERNSFVFYKEWKDAIVSLPKDVRLEIYEAIIEYGISGKAPELKQMSSIAFSFIKADIDRNIQRYERIVERNRENGKSGGRPKTKPKETQRNPTKPKETLNDNDNDNDNDIKKESPNGDKKEADASSCSQTNNDYQKFQDWLTRKAPYCSNIKNFPSQITETEFMKLKEKYTGKQIAETIEQIENRKDLRKRYTNLYRTVLNWAKKEYGS